ncbi:MAG: hypothetical protein QXW65_02350 [Candidatus Pacearchaeota archaeon]
MPILQKEIKKYEGPIEDMPQEVIKFIKDGGLDIIYYGKRFPSYELKTFGKNGRIYHVCRDATQEDKYICIEEKIKKITI